MHRRLTFTTNVPPETGYMEKLPAILVCILLPLAWGLGAEYVFELLRRRGARVADMEDLVE